MVKTWTENPCATGSIQVSTVFKIKPLQNCKGFLFAACGIGVGVHSIFA